MRLKYGVAIIVILLAARETFAGMRISGGLGFGSTTTSNEVSASEGPLTQMYTIESVIHSRLIAGAEHIRSLQMSPIATSIAFTGVFGQFYLSSVPTPYLKAEGVSDTNITFRDLGYFVGCGLGLVQSSRVPDENGKSSNAAGIYLSPRGGVDIQLTRSFGLRSALVMGMMMMGQGSVSSTSVMETVYWSF